MTKIFFIKKFKKIKKKLYIFSSNKNLNVYKIGVFYKQKLEMEKFLIKKNFPEQYLVLKLGKIIS